MTNRNSGVRTTSAETGGDREIIDNVIRCDFGASSRPLSVERGDDLPSGSVGESRRQREVASVDTLYPDISSTSTPERTNTQSNLRRNLAVLKECQEHVARAVRYLSEGMNIESDGEIEVMLCKLPGVFARGTTDGFRGAINMIQLALGSRSDPLDEVQLLALKSVVESVREAPLLASTPTTDGAPRCPRSRRSATTILRGRGGRVAGFRVPPGESFAAVKRRKSLAGAVRARARLVMLDHAGARHQTPQRHVARDLQREPLTPSVRLCGAPVRCHAVERIHHVARVALHGLGAQRCLLRKHFAEASVSSAVHRLAYVRHGTLHSPCRTACFGTSAVSPGSNQRPRPASLVRVIA